MSSLPNYSITRVIGSGCFGFVFEAFDKTKKQKVALKRIQKVGDQLSRQYQVLLQIKDCQNVVKMLVFYALFRISFTQKTEDGKLIQTIVFEYIESNLEKLLEMHIKNGTQIPEEQIKSIVFQILNGLNYIHSKNISHRDLKPENILISKNNVIKICDFGSSKQINKNGKNTPYIVSRYYRAPQLILALSDYSTPIDIWATGCILAELYLLHPFFKGKTEGDQIFSAFKILGSFTPEQKQIYQKLVPFQRQLLDEISDFKRVDLKSLFPMVKDFNNFSDLLLKMLQFVPQKRISAKQALNHPFFNDVEKIL